MKHILIKIKNELVQLENVAGIESIKGKIYNLQEEILSDKKASSHERNIGIDMLNNINEDIESILDKKRFRKLILNLQNEIRNI